MTHTPTDLPPLPDESVDRIERAVMTRIASEPREAPRTRRRGRGWLVAGGVAAAFALGAVVPPIVSGGFGPSLVGSTSADYAVPDSAPEAGVAESSAPAEHDGAVSAVEREIVQSGQATVRVDDVDSALATLRGAVEDRDGYIESMSSTSRSDDGQATEGRIVVRVPAEDLLATMDELGEIGDVRSSETSADDVTAEAIDLRARVDATKASVERLTELMSSADSVGALLDAEIALTDRQAELESYERQLASLDEQVAMSQLSVLLVTPGSDDDGPPEGLAALWEATWKSFVASAGSIVVVIAFAAPWAVVIGIVVFAVRRIRRRRRARRSDARDAS